MENKKCVRCGLCKYECPVLRVMLNEKYSPRGKMIDIENIEDIAYYCTLCGACEVSCPVSLEVPEKIREARIKLVKAGKETQANKHMIENVRKFGNPFGEIKSGEKPKELYCC
ncbi:MAG: 4Fe-4S dicluster domain-containing protein [Candidatus Nanoarchaeia archaeon]|nr:4Fe-4S dicluster domain-containing protein [Candidatus Nanoarchaeia archaeon]